MNRIARHFLLATALAGMVCAPAAAVSVTLIADAKPRAVIVLAEAPTPAARKAAALIRESLREISGATLDTVSERRLDGVSAHGRLLSGCLSQDWVIVTELAEGSTADWPGPFGDPQTNTFALPREPNVKLVPMREIGRK